MKSGILPSVVIGAGAIIAEAVAQQFGDDKWVQTVRDVGFPIVTAIACGLALRWIGRRMLQTHDRFTDSVIQENKRSNRRLRSIDRKMDEQLMHLKDIAVRISHQTNVVRSEAAHTADVLVEADKQRSKS